MNSTNSLLTCLYDAHAQWLGSHYTFACGPGCCTCCTSSVTMTTLEGRQIMDYLAGTGRLNETAERLATRRPLFRPLQTTNQFAASCLTRSCSDAEPEPAWDLTPCLFLDNDLCTIYPVRPFGCRAFASNRSCRGQGSAELDPLLITVNTIMLQIIEHLDSSGGRFGNLAEVLQFLLPETGTSTAGLLTARPNPGFMVLPGEARLVAGFLGRINRSACGCILVGQALAESGVYAGRKVCQ